MKAVMYHYVREYDADYPHFRFLDIENFRKQLNYFEQEFGFVDKQEWLDFIQSGKMPKEPGKILLTFDDAMSCHYNYVYPELMKNDLWGIFYVPTQPYQDHKILDVHRIHLLCGAYEGKQLLEKALELVSDEMIPDAKREEFRKKTYLTQKNYEGVSEFKRLLNYFIDYQYCSDVIDAIAESFDFQFDASRFYVSKSELHAMKNDGMIIGSHTVSHPVMSKLSSNEQLSELDKSFSTLEGVIDSSHKTYCHPYGGFHSFNDDTVRLLDKLGVHYSFNVEARDIESDDWQNSKQHLPRYDCNLFKYGQAS